MEPGYRSPLIDQFRHSDTTREMRLLAAQGGLEGTAHEQLALLLLVADDPDSEVAAAVQATVRALPVEPLRAYLARADAPEEIKQFFGNLGFEPGPVPAADASAPLLEAPDEDDEPLIDAVAPTAAAPVESKLLSGLPVKRKVKLAFKGTREQRAQLIRDPNKLVASAVLSSPKLTGAEVESFAKMG